MPFNLDDYVSVDERVQIFYKTFKDGRLQTREVRFCEWPQPGILAVAEAYRTPDDPHPGVGTAWEPVPGKTQFTRDSEVQNAETAAWGRAIVACGIGSKPGQIASREEVAARQTETPRPVGPAPDQEPAGDEHQRAHEQRSTLDLKEPDRENITPLQVRRLFSIARGEYELSDATIKATIEACTGQTSSRQIKRYQYDAVMDELARVALAVPK